MVQAQHRLVTEGLGVNHLRLVMGTSMGGMHTWLWGETFPRFMDALMPLASLPVAIAGRNRMIRRMVLDAIRERPGLAGRRLPRAAAARPALRHLHPALHGQRPAAVAACRRRPLEAADQMFDRLVAEYAAKLDANDMLYQFDASRDYDPAPDLEQIEAPLLAVNSADDQVNPPELGILEDAIRRVRRGRHVLIPISAETCGHRTHSAAALWQDHLAGLLKRTRA